MPLGYQEHWSYWYHCQQPHLLCNLDPTRNAWSVKTVFTISLKFSSILGTKAKTKRYSVSHTTRFHRHRWRKLDFPFYLYLVRKATHEHTISRQLTHVTCTQFPYLCRNAVLLHERLLCEMKLEWIISTQTNTETTSQVLGQWIPIIVQKQRIVAQWWHRDSNLTQVVQILEYRYLHIRKCISLQFYKESNKIHSTFRSKSPWEIFSDSR